MTNQDKDIWESFRNGDKAAFEQLLLQYYRPMFDYGIRIQSDTDQLRDDLHDLMVNLWERREHLRATEHLKFYLFKALRHQILKGKRKKGIFVDSGSLNEDAVDENDDMLFGFEKEEADERQSHQIRRMLLKLSKRQQEVLHLKFFEEFSNEQIAESLGISRAATANLLYTSLQAFKVLWKVECYPLLLLLSSWKSVSCIIL
ncbi:RNA polymerase sigma factor [Dyadobacter sp. CY323]|uniref:RNA polymerase sigma factor n=1 Tax=Dyadobacter sp. CY323 TaxID=2907302 RepID=UPI001F1F52CD|nr:sigma-70 family RNA polymerase sigma factor [Dyadobacter sp. CY323]MCE6989867.1 sigma-70 family RNA polymerase sigma factor [Dyadobacter sp. CY323]